MTIPELDNIIEYLQDQRDRIIKEPKVTDRVLHETYLEGLKQGSIHARRNKIEAALNDMNQEIEREKVTP